MSDGSTFGEVPDYVTEDVSRNPELRARWISDVEFRRGLLEADNPSSFAREQGFEVSDATSDWIKQRVAARGLDALIGDGGPVTSE